MWRICTYSCYIDRFPGSHVPLMHTHWLGFKNEDKDMEAYKSEPCYHQPVWLVSVHDPFQFAARREKILTVFRLHLPQDTQLCVDPHEYDQCCNSELQNRKSWVGQVIWIHKVWLDSWRRRERRSIQDCIYHGWIHDGACLEGICLSRFQWRSKYPPARRNIFEEKKKTARRQEHWGDMQDISRASILYVLELMGSVG
jgi:hypothetical protein